MSSQSGQTESSRDKNYDWFRRNNGTYSDNVETIDSYARIGLAIEAALVGRRSIVDIGNGGVFAYDTTPFESVLAVDLFVEDLDTSKHPPNIRFRKGDALDLPLETGSLEAVVVVMLLHHLAGPTVRATMANMERCLVECHRVLAPSGKLVLVESCVPPWFFALQCLAYPLAVRALDKLIAHPVTFQDTHERLRHRVEGIFGEAGATHIPKGKYVLQYGLKVPSLLTPVQPYLITAIKR